MEKSLKLYWQKECESLIATIQSHLTAMFGINVLVMDELEPPISAFDPYRQQYDVRYLINELGTESYGLWILNIDISDPTHLYLYGAASDQVAIASSYRTGNEENFIKEICHEVGHLLGLEHCKNQCLMQTSRNTRQLNKKPLSLCNRCIKRLQKNKKCNNWILSS